LKLGATGDVLSPVDITEHLNPAKPAAELIFTALALALNLFLLQSFDLPHIDWYYAPAGMLILLLLGQLSVIGTAGSATRISPAVHKQAPQGACEKM
jgi:hypothetical protein